MFRSRTIVQIFNDLSYFTFSQNVEEDSTKTINNDRQ